MEINTEDDTIMRHIFRCP